MLLGAVFCFLYMTWRGVRLRDVLRETPAMAYVVCVGGLVGNNAFYYTGMKMAPIMEANLVNYLWPLFVVLFGAVINGLRLRIVHVLGIICGFFGAAACIAGSEPGGFATLRPRDFELFTPILIGAMIWGLYSTLIRRIAFGVHFMGVVFFLCGLILAGLHIWLEDTPAHLTFAMGAGLFALGVLNVAYVLWDRAMKGGDVILLSTFAYAVPVVSTLLLLVAGRASWNGYTLIGGVLITVAACLANPEPIKKAARRLMPTRRPVNIQRED